MFRRRTTAPSGASAPDHSETGSGATVASGKGRATPTRRAAEEARKQRLAPPKGRKQAAARQREQRRTQRQQAREALASGNAQHLPQRDRGPVRRFCRDFVDARRSVAEFLLPVLVAVLVLGFFRDTAAITSLIFLVTMVALVVDSVLLASRLRKELRRRFPADSLKGATMYAVLRSSQMRRLRLPKPQVKAGQRV